MTRPRGRIVVVGVDLAGSPTRPTGMCTLAGMRAVTADVFTDNEILSWVSAARPLTVGIDAPLTLPPGRRSIADHTGAHFRPCDLELRRRGIRFFPVTLGPMRMLTTRGMSLRRRLRRRGIRVIEVFPGGAQDLWNLPRKQHDLAGLRRGLIRLGVRGLGRALSDHELDAVSAALVARDYARGHAEIYGPGSPAPFVMPRPNHNPG